MFRVSRKEVTLRSTIQALRKIKYVIQSVFIVATLLQYTVYTAHRLLIHIIVIVISSEQGSLSDQHRSLSLVSEGGP